MSESDILSFCWVALGLACIAAFLYFVTSGDEPPGFRVVPVSSGEWGRYAYRTLVLLCTLSMLFARTPYIHPIVRSVWGISTFLLLVSSTVLSRFDPAFSRIGFGLTILSGVLAL